MARGPATGNPFFDQPSAAVFEQIDIVNAAASRAFSFAIGSIASLGNVDFINDSPQSSQFLIPDIHIPSAVTPSRPDVRIFGTLSPDVDAEFVDRGVTNDITDELAIQPGDFTSTIGAPVIPAAPVAISTAGAPDVPAARTITLPAQPDRTAPAAPELIAIDPRTFEGITAPLEPALTTVEPPSAPTVTPPTTPTLRAVVAPTLVSALMPDPPTLIEITVPTFDGIDAPTINDVEPTFTAAAPRGISFREPTYSSALLANTQALITRIYSGELGIPTAVQQALFDAARTREDDTELAAEQGAFDTWAGRNFSMPPGMLVEAVTAAQEKSRLNANALSRDILTKATEWQLKMVSEAVAHGVALETVLQTSFNLMAQRLFEVAKAQSEIEVKIYDVAVTLFNAQQTARQIGATIFRAKWDGEIARAGVYKTQVDAEVAKGQLNVQKAQVYATEWEGAKNAVEIYKAQWEGESIKTRVNDQLVNIYKAQWDGEASKVNVYKVGVDATVAKGQLNEQLVQIFRGQWEGELARVQAFKAEIDGEIAKGQINEQKIRVYLGQWEGVKNAVEVYKQLMQGAMIEAEIGRSEVESYGARVRAFDTVVQTRKLPFEIFTEQLKGESLKASMLASQVQGFAETVRAQENEANVKIKLIDLKLGAARASTEQYLGRLQGKREHIQAELASIQASATAYGAEVGRYRVELEGVNQARAEELKVAELRLQSLLSYYGIQLREFDAVLARQIDRTKILVGAEEGAGRIAATLASGAYSAVHVQAAIHGTGSVTNSNSYGEQRNQSTNSQITATLLENMNFDNPDAPPSIPMPNLPTQ